jgi:asparagine synthase (glutamine-hydrolysing)
MTSSDGRLTVAFNGEIYNFMELRGELSRQGVRFATQGDTEVLLHMYRLHGPDMLQHIHGMFAFALYDAGIPGTAGGPAGAAQAGPRLMLARDRLGQKPLWYSVTPSGIAFASEAKALREHDQVPRSIDNQSLIHYFTMGYIPAPRTIWQGVAKLRPAEALLASAAPAQPYIYWQPKPAPSPAPRQELLAQVKDTLAQAVRTHMVANVPVGALLSGGIDSSIIVALMATLAGKGGGVRTFTAGFAASAYDERAAAKRVASHCGTEHKELLIEPIAPAMLDELAKMYDEPFADSSSLPTWLICRQAAQHVTVALAGDGGDEAFAGYDRYRALYMAQRMRWPAFLALRLAASLARPWAGQDQRNKLRRFLRFADALPQPYAQQYFTYRRLFDPADLARLFSASFAQDIDLLAGENWFLDLYEDADGRDGDLGNELDKGSLDEVARAQVHDMRTYLGDDLLVKTDIASMASSLELRAPMLDDGVVAKGLSLPTELKLDRHHGKLALRQAFADMLPAEVFAGPKRGFGVPLADWLRTDLKETLRQNLLNGPLADSGMFNTRSLAGLVNDHVQGTDDHSHRLWSLLMFARWLACNK